jgi:hypothetical protein
VLASCPVPCGDLAIRVAPLLLIMEANMPSRRCQPKRAESSATATPLERKALTRMQTLVLKTLGRSATSRRSLPAPSTQVVCRRRWRNWLGVMYDVPPMITSR